MPKTVRRIDNAYDEEKYYATTPVTSVAKVIRVDAHKLLDYARARLDVAMMLATDFAEQPQTGVIGFLTGSIGLLATARELLEPFHPGKFKFAMGLSHANGGDAGEDELHAILNELRGMGVLRVVLVDEVKSGTQMRTGIQATLRWVQTTCATDVEVSAIGVSGAPPKGKDRPPTVAEVVAPIINARRLINPRSVTTVSLLEMDTDGLIFRGVKRTHHVGEYDFCRVQPVSGLYVSCPNDGPRGGAGVRSLDTAFAGTINRILGLSNPAEAAQPFDLDDEPDGELLTAALTWPDTIEGGSCTTCQDLLRLARVTARARHSWTRTAAYYLSEHDRHPPGRELDYWLAAEKQAREEGKRLGAPPWLIR